MRAGALVLLAAVVVGHAAPSAAQDLRARLRAAPDGDVTFRFAARTGVCGDGDVVVRQRPGTGTSISFVGDMSSRDSRDFDLLDTWCRPGPVRITLRRSNDDIEAMRISVGDSARDGFDLGAVSPEEAVDWLVRDVARQGDRRTASRALHAASLAAAEAWQPMLELARDASVEEKVRTGAIHWLAVDAADRLLAGEAPIDEEMKLRREAVFSLSRRNDEPSREALRDLTRRGTEPAIRSAAVYWLAIEEKDEALPLLESVLRGG